MRIPGPTDLVRLAGQGYQAAERLIGLVPRLVSLLDQVEQLMGRATGIAADAEQLIGRADVLMRRADDLLRRAGGAADEAEQLVHDAAGLLEPFRPALHRMEEIAARIADTTSTGEVDAVVQVINMLPEVVGSLRQDILPILNTLDTVAPDLREMLIVSHELNEILGSIPGLGRAKHRIEHDIPMPEPLAPAAGHRPDVDGPSPAPPRAGHDQRK